MLTKAHRVYHWDRLSNSIFSDRLEEDCVPLLARGIAVYRARIGDRLGLVRNAARTVLQGLRPDRIEAAIDLLDEVATYEWPRGGRQGDERVKIFAAAADAHPLLDPESRGAILGPALGESVFPDGGLTARLYADYPEFHRLTAFPETYSAADLRDDYDLAQAQALLYDATAVEVDAGADLKHIVQYARLSRLLHRLERLADGRYRLSFDGPNSVLRRTHAYGVDFAKFLAALVQARDWQITARVAIHARARPALYRLSSKDGLRSRLAPPSLFDSDLEEKFAEKFGAVRNDWRLGRETMLLEAGTSLLVPDFSFRHADGTEVAMEIVGYWTPEYLARKFRKLAVIHGVNLIVAVRRQWALAAGDPPPWVLPFKTAILLKDLMPRLEAFRRQAPRLGRPRGD